MAVSTLVPRSCFILLLQRKIGIPACATVIMLTTRCWYQNRTAVASWQGVVGSHRSINSQFELHKMLAKKCRRQCGPPPRLHLGPRMLLELAGSSCGQFCLARGDRFLIGPLAQVAMQTRHIRACCHFCACEIILNCT